MMVERFIGAVVNYSPNMSNHFSVDHFFLTHLYVGGIKPAGSKGREQTLTPSQYEGKMAEKVIFSGAATEKELERDGNFT